MSETWKQVVMEADPSTMKPSDVAMLGPPPRELTPAHEKYIKLAKPSFAGLLTVLAVLSVGGTVIMFATVGFEAQMIPHLWFPALMIGLAMWSRKNSGAKRNNLRRVLREGSLRFARVEQNIQTAHGRGMSKKYRYQVIFNVDGRRVMVESWQDAIGMLENGSLVEIVYLPDVPDELIPTFMLA